MTNIRRYPPNGAPVFITTVTANRDSILASNVNKQLLLEIIREVKIEHDFSMLGYVILNDHFHLIIKTRDADISKIMQSVKLRFTRRYIKQTSSTKEQSVSLWQRRFWDHVIRDENDFQRHLDYIHYNPVKHGVAVSAYKFVFSSFRAYVERGAYSLDWGLGVAPSQISSMDIE
jgi:putative transposase